MKAKTTWTFSCPIDEVDPFRIVREAGPDARVVRFTIRDKVYTAVNTDWLESTGYELDWEHELPTFLGPHLSVPYLNSDDEVIIHVHYDPKKWAVIKGDHAGKFLDRVKTKVEVF